MKKQNNEKETGKRFKLGSILSTKEENKEMTLPQKVEAISCYVLESKGCFDSAHSMTATDIYKEYKNIKSNRNHKNIYELTASLERGCRQKPRLLEIIKSFTFTRPSPISCFFNNV